MACTDDEASRAMLTSANWWGYVEYMEYVYLFIHSFIHSFTMYIDKHGERERERACSFLRLLGPSCGFSRKRGPASPLSCP